MGTCSPFAVTLRSDPSSPLKYKTWEDPRWLTVGTTGSSSSCATCTTSTTTDSSTKTTSSAWPSATQSLRPRADLADFNKDGEVSTDECKKAIKDNCMGKKYADMPAAFRQCIEGFFKTIDVDGDGTVGLDEYRSDCVKRMAYK